MNKYKIEEILSNIQFQVYSDMNFIEPLGLDKETWKELLDYITNSQKEINRLNNIIDKTIHYIEYEMPCLWEVDEVFEDMNGRDYNTWKEYDENKLLDILKGDNK
jgi:hypothetical protein